MVGGCSYAAEFSIIEIVSFSLSDTVADLVLVAMVQELADFEWKVVCVGWHFEEERRDDDEVK